MKNLVRNLRLLKISDSRHESLAVVRDTVGVNLGRRGVLLGVSVWSILGCNMSKEVKKSRG